jgi:hypothetical protein
MAGGLGISSWISMDIVKGYDIRYQRRSRWISKDMMYEK